MSRGRRFLPALEVRKDCVKILAVLFGLAGANVLFFLAVNLPKNRELGRLRGESERLDRQVREWEAVVAEQQEMIERVRFTRSRLEEFYGGRLSTKKAKMTNIQREIRRIAKQFGIDPESIQYAHEAVEGQNLVQFDLQVPLVGSYTSLRQFLQQVESSDHFLMINQIYLTGSKEGGTQLSLNIRLATFFAAEEAPGPEAEAGAPPEEAPAPAPAAEEDEA